jgi:hypothetical protein
MLTVRQPSQAARAGVAPVPDRQKGQERSNEQQHEDQHLDELLALCGLAGDEITDHEDER